MKVDFEEISPAPPQATAYRYNVPALQGQDAREEAEQEKDGRCPARRVVRCGAVEVGLVDAGPVRHAVRDSRRLIEVSAPARGCCATAERRPSAGRCSSSCRARVRKLHFFSGIYTREFDLTASPQMTVFRPCIDLHAGKVKQIVGATLSPSGPEERDGNLKTNFVSTYFRVF